MNHLAEIATIAEVARMFHKNRMSVRRAIDGGQIPLRARLSDHVWLIDLDSCRARWGEPRLALNPMYNM